MIVAMKKVAIIVQQKDKDTALSRVRGAGVLHVEHQRPPAGKDIASLQEDLTLANEALIILGQKELCHSTAEHKAPADWRHCARHLIDTRKRIDQLEEYARGLQHSINQWEEWGDFDPQAIRQLSEKGIYVKLYAIPEKNLQDLSMPGAVKTIFISSGIAHCVMVSRQPPDIPYKEIPLPKMALREMQRRLAEEARLIETLKKHLCDSVCYQKHLAQIRKSLENNLEYAEALRGMGEEATLAYLVGYVPADAVKELQKLAQKESWGLWVTEPTAEDNVPTFLRNPRWVTLINPVFKFIEVVPGYREFDISLWFLIFLSFFFGVIIGDAGYGAIYFALTLFAHRKLSHKIKDKTTIYLFYVFSLCAITWGLLSGTIFGTTWLKGKFNPLVPALADDKVVRRLFFLVGATHLSIAHIWRIIIQLPSFIALTEVGWICILWAAFFLARTLLLGDSLPAWIMPLIISGCVLVVFYSNPRKNILRRVLAGLGTLALNLMNNFTDIVSYIRLFAVGLAGVAVANAFNAMAADVAGMGVLSAILGGLILFAGHGLNIILGPMSVLVHGVRLNVLEFCMHLDVKWSGFAYKPLKEETV